MSRLFRRDMAAMTQQQTADALGLNIWQVEVAEKSAMKKLKSSAQLRTALKLLLDQETFEFHEILRRPTSAERRETL